VIRADAVAGSTRSKLFLIGSPQPGNEAGHGPVPDWKPVLSGSAGNRLIYRFGTTCHDRD